jgi:hypothetical protein
MFLDDTDILFNINNLEKAYSMPPCKSEEHEKLWHLYEPTEHIYVDYNSDVEKFIMSYIGLNTNSFKLTTNNMGKKELSAHMDQIVLSFFSEIDQIKLTLMVLKDICLRAIEDFARTVDGATQQEKYAKVTAFRDGLDTLVKSAFVLHFKKPISDLKKYWIEDFAWPWLDHTGTAPLPRAIKDDNNSYTGLLGSISPLIFLSHIYIWCIHLYI